MIPRTEVDDRVVVELGQNVYTFKVQDFSSLEVDIDELLFVHINNLVADMITFPVVLNRLAMIKAKADDLLRGVEFDNKVFYAQLYEDHKKKLIANGEKATETGIEMAIKRDPKYIVKMKDLFKVQKNADIVTELYWSAKSKDKKLESLSAKIKPDDFEREILVDSINGVLIRASKNVAPVTRR